MKDKPITRRGIVSIVSAVYDPLGFVAPFILQAKRLLQDLCRKSLGWDDLVSNEELARWQNRLSDLTKLESLRVERCLKSASFGEITSSQIHHFADACQFAYGVVSYLRATNGQGDTHCSFLIIGKTLLSPRKQLTIPRLELSAAVVAARLDRMLRQEIDMQVGESVFWTDSSCVLGYIGNVSRQEDSSPSQWRHVSSEQNPADDAHRGCSAEALTNNSRWLRGRDFLRQPVHTWPIRPFPVPEVAHGDPEVKKGTEVFLSSTEVRERSMNRIFEYFSSWYRLKKFFAWMLRFRVKLRDAVEQRRTGRVILTENMKIDPITLAELESAEREIIRHVQNESFEEEVATRVPQF